MKICMASFIILSIAFKTISGNSLLRSVDWLYFCTISSFWVRFQISSKACIESLLSYLQTLHITFISLILTSDHPLCYQRNRTFIYCMCLSEAPTGNFWYSPPPLASETKFTLFTNASKTPNVYSYFINFMNIKTSKYFHNYGIIIKLASRAM